MATQNEQILSKVDQLIAILNKADAELAAAQKNADAQAVALTEARAELERVHALAVDADTKADALVKKTALVQVLEVSASRAAEAVKPAQLAIKAAGSAAGRAAGEVAGQVRAFEVAADTATIYALVDSSKTMPGSLPFQEVTRALKSESVFGEWQRRFFSAFSNSAQTASEAVAQLASRWNEFRPLVTASGVTLKAI